MKEIEIKNKTIEDTSYIEENCVIEKAKTACQNSDISVLEHFVGIDKMIKMPKSTKKIINV